MNRAAEQVLMFGQQLEVFLQVLVGKRTLDFLTLSDFSNGAIYSETSVTTKKT